MFPLKGKQIGGKNCDKHKGEFLTFKDKEVMSVHEKRGQRERKRNKQQILTRGENVQFYFGNQANDLKMVIFYFC